jgi:hypothetical protein
MEITTPIMWVRDVNFTLKFKSIVGGGLVKYTLIVVSTKTPITLPSSGAITQLARKAGLKKFRETRRESESNLLRWELDFETEAPCRAEPRAWFVASVSLNLAYRIR